MTLQGIDISSYQNITDYNELAKNKLSFCYIKATEGIIGINPIFKQQFKGITENTGILTGAYHFFHFEQDPTIQANHFCDTIREVCFTLPPVIDIEQPKPTLSPKDYSKAVSKFIGVVTNVFGNCGIYSEAWYIQSYLDNPTQFSANFNWAAGKAVPFTTNSLAFFQVGTSKSLIGINEVDVDVFYGDIDQLFAMAGGMFNPSISVVPAIKGLQNRLKALGYYNGVIDGQRGEATSTAIGEWQTANNCNGEFTPQQWGQLFN